LLHVQLDMRALYQSEGDAHQQRLRNALQAQQTQQAQHDESALSPPSQSAALAGIVWTPSMRRMYTLVDRCACMHAKAGSKKSL
jgi:midasin